MIRSMYSGISGMKNQQVKMDVIGNNIANLGTTAFKGSRVTFKDALNQTMQGASAPTFAVGGVNPRQVGLGMSVSSVDTDMRQGTLQPTGRATDIAVQGNGYFMVSNGSEVLYTRDGSFTLDRYGNLVTSEGMRVMGVNGAGNRTPITMPMEHNSVAPIVMGHDDGGTFKEVLQIKLYGFDGNPDLLKNIKVVNTAPAAKADQPVKVANGELTIDLNGYTSLTDLEKAITSQFTAVSGKDVDTLTPAEKEIKNLLDKGIYGVTVTGDFNEALKLTTGDATAVPPVAKMDLNVSPKAKEGAGGADDAFKTQKVQINSFSIGKDGTIRGVYGEDTFEVARLEIAKFVNDAGLEKAGSNLYRQSANSGEAERGFPGDIGFGTSEQGFLEMANVDLANEFTEMIVTSRSYQANSRTITTSDEMLQELLNLKR